MSYNPIKYYCVVLLDHDLLDAACRGVTASPRFTGPVGYSVAKLHKYVDTHSTTGNEDVDLRRSYFEDADAGVLVVNIADTDSISRVPDLKQSILEFTKTKSDFATKVQEEEEEGEGGESEERLVDLPVLVLGECGGVLGGSVCVRWVSVC